MSSNENNNNNRRINGNNTMPGSNIPCPTVEQYELWQQCQFFHSVSQAAQHYNNAMVHCPFNNPPLNHWAHHSTHIIPPSTSNASNDLPTNTEKSSFKNSSGLGSKI